MNPASRSVLACVFLATCCVVSVARAGNPLSLLPTPKVLSVDGGEMSLAKESRIVSTDPKLRPLADILADEILLVTGLRPAVVEVESGPGDIVLKINQKLRADADILTVHGQDVLKTREYAHAIRVSDRAVVEGWDYRAVCEGTATLLQAIVLRDGRAFVPRMTVKDWPYSDYGAIMVDCARQHQPVYVLKMAAETCRLFKIRYLHLHLSDDNAYTFPSTAYPEANSKCGIRAYTLDELKDLVAYADARGITCVPELEGPGHCTSLLDGMGGKLGSVGNRTMDVLNPDIYPVLDRLVGETCDVFKSSPYFHIGGDEVEPAWYLGNAHVKQYMKDHNLTGEHTIWLPYGQKMAEIVKRYAKKTLMWDGLPVGVPIDKSLIRDIILYSWFPRKGRAREAQDMGYTTITVPWDMPPFPEFSMFTCNNDVLTPKDKVLGHCRPMWEMDHIALANGYLRGAPERHERTWGPESVIEEGYQTNRMAKQNSRADMIIRPVAITYEGRVNDGVFNDPITVAMNTVVPGAQIRYTLDGKEPTAASALYEKPLRLTESLDARAVLFDAEGKRLGNTSLARLRYVRFEPSLTTSKPAAQSGEHQGEDKPWNATDGWTDITKYWGAWGPAWWQVDLQQECLVSRVQVVPFWDGDRYYKYTVSVGTETNALVQVVDARGNTEIGTEKGYTHKFAPTRARYIRVNMLKNSANPAVHLVEVRAWGEDGGHGKP